MSAPFPILLSVGDVQGGTTVVQSVSFDQDSVHFTDDGAALNESSLDPGFYPLTLLSVDILDKADFALTSVMLNGVETALPFAVNPGDVVQVSIKKTTPGSGRLLATLTV